MKPSPPKSNLTVIADSFKNTGPNSSVFQPALDMLGIDRRSLEIVTSVKGTPKFMLVLGDDALNTLSTIPCKVSEVRGFVLDSNLGCPMIATYSPWQLANGGYGTLMGVFLHDIRTAMRFATHGVPEPMETSYDLYGKNVRAYIDSLIADPLLPVALDVETAHILGEKEGERPSERRLVQIQFSSSSGTAIVLPWPSQEALEILALPNPKITWNGRLFDIPVLKSQGVVINGECHDAMLMWSHLQPGFMSSKDDTSGDKGVPAKLMGLQSCLSFYYPAEMPWKGILEKVKGAGYDFDLGLRHYGAIDADMTFRLGVKLMDALRKGGLWDGYVAHKLKLGLVLDDLSLRGLPVDREKQTSLRNYITAEETRLTTELQALIPPSLLPVHAFKGWPRDLRAALATAGALVRKTSPLLHWEGYKNVFEGLDYTIRDGVLVKLLPFNPDSSKQLLDYIQFKGYRVPLHIDTHLPTTGKEAMEQLVTETGDEVLKLVQKTRKLTKLGGTYCDGAWIPGEDGRVHGTFRFGTASGQTSCTKPNIQQFPEHYDKKDEWITDIMKRVKGTIKAEAGHKLVKIDARGAHAKMQGFLAEDAAYMRLASIDVHSYITAHYVREPDRKTLLSLSDTELEARLNEVKAIHKETRDAKIKRCVYLMQFSGGAAKAFEIMSAFESVVEVQQLMDLIKGLFPKTFAEFPKKVAAQLKRHPRLVTAQGACRWNWDNDLQQAVAFMVANNFHGHVQSAMVRLFEQGVFEKYGACNFTHDAVWLHVKDVLLDEGILAVMAEMERPSEVLFNSLGYFQCGASAQVGDDLLSMEDYTPKTSNAAATHPYIQCNAPGVSVTQSPQSQVHSTS
jgi:DNA polymerase family A